MCVHLFHDALAFFVHGLFVLELGSCSSIAKCFLCELHAEKSSIWWGEKKNIFCTLTSYLHSPISGYTSGMHIMPNIKVDS